MPEGVLMVFTQCLDCEETFQHTQTTRHRDEKHPYGFPAHHVAGDAGTSAYQEDQ